MAKNKMYSVDASLEGPYDGLAFNKEPDGTIFFCADSYQIHLTVKEAKELADKLRQCCKE